MASKRRRSTIFSGNLKTKALSHIQNKLLAGDLSWGHRISEEEIAKELGTSRTPVREALNHYTQIGVFERLHRVGTVLKMPDVRDVEELYEIRIALEIYAVSQAIKYISSDELRTLEGTCQVIKKMESELMTNGNNLLSLDQALSLFENDQLFHLTIIKASGNRLLLKQITENRLLTRICGGNHLQKCGANSLSETFEDHMAIYNAVKERDSDSAVLAMRKHITSSKNSVTTHLRKEFDAMDAGENSSFKLSA